MDEKTNGAGSEREEKYALAKADLLKAKESFSRLDGEQKDRMLNELLPKRLVYLAKLFAPSLTR